MQHNQFINDIIALTKAMESGEKVGGIKLARIIKRLTELEIEEGGPYSFEPQNGMASADVGLNLAVAIFLRMQNVDLPKLDAFLNDQFKKPTESLVGILGEEIINELISKYKNISRCTEGQDPIKKSIIYDQDEQRIMDAIRKCFDKRFASFSSKLQDRAKASIEKTIRSNRDKQMSLMAHYTKMALGEAGKTVSDELIAEIGLANIFFWTAFIIYDDFWDQDPAADPRLLPIANIFARHYTDFYINLSEDKEFRPFFHDLMDKLDAANAWEVENCRAKVEGDIFYIPQNLPDFGDYEKKYRPASGHILASVAVFTKIDRDLKPEDWGNIVSYFKHYLIAMQLNDDAHDWEEDLRRGHLSTVVTLLLSDLKKNGWEKPTIDFATDLPELRKIFWFNTMPQYVKIVLSQAAASREALRTISIIENPEPLERIVSTTENVARLAEKESQDSDALLKEYANT